MALKHFHIVFLVFAFLCDAGFWLWLHFLPEAAVRANATGLKPFVGITCLLILAYGTWYITRKLRTIPD
jgi:hypothetical protein